MAKEYGIQAIMNALKTKEELENYLSDYNSIENHLGQLIYGYELAAKFHESLFYGRYSDHYFN